MDIQEFITGGVCRRVVLDQVMDAPRARVGCEEEEEACDICKRQREEEVGDSGFGSSHAMTFPSSPPVSSDINKYERTEFEEQMQRRNWVQSSIAAQRCQEGSEVKELVEFFEEWSGKCQLCHWRGGPNPWHDIKECPREEAGHIQRMIDNGIKGIKYEAFSCCYYCGVLQAICERWEQREEKGWWQRREGGSC